MAKKFKPGEVKELKKNQYVLDVAPDRLVLTLPFRQRLFDEWCQKPETETVKQILEQAGIPFRMVGSNYVKDIIKNFKRSGRPKKTNKGNQGNCAPAKRSEEMTALQLIATGKFVRSGNGVILEPNYMKELFEQYPEQSVEEGLKKVGLTKEMVGAHRIVKITKEFEKTIEFSHSLAETGGHLFYNAAKIAEYEKHPYVANIATRLLMFTDTFYNEAKYLLPMSTVDILKVFEIDVTLTSFSDREGIREKIVAWEPTGEKVEGDSELIRKIMRNRIRAMTSLIDKEIKSFQPLMQKMTQMEKKMVCEWLIQMPKDPEQGYSLLRIAELLGISRGLFYRALKDEDYGTKSVRKEVQDEADFALIKTVADYKGFAKGTRQIYMLLPKLTGQVFSLKKIRRLKKKYRLNSGIRESKNRRASAEYIAAQTKPNILKRRFRMFRPNKVRLTDITYLDYGPKKEKRAYGSALLDPVTSRLIVFTVSENNDIELANETLRQSDTHPCDNGGIIHSDQGSIYLSPKYQLEVECLGLQQSMSKRGNCWDNAPQESFFGHFKDECDYEKCQTLEELKNEIEKYAEYYNYERGMWDRKRMTPVEYERYLESLSEEDFASYINEEEEKYRKMQENATKKAKERAKTLGV